MAKIVTFSVRVRTDKLACHLSLRPFQAWLAFNFFAKGLDGKRHC